MADHEAAARCRRSWPDQPFTLDGRSVAPRARCTTCRCYTIPVRLVHEPEGSCRIEAPGKYPCAVCGQMDQYINVWINARARHHAESQRLLREQGFVTTAFGGLRAPLEDELPVAGDEPFTGFAQVGLVASVTTLRVNAGDPRFVSCHLPAPVSLECGACCALVRNSHA
jgi:hypothetical protein